MKIVIFNSGFGIFCFKGDVLILVVIELFDFGYCYIDIV